jgi:hypothetical protein
LALSRRGAEHRYGGEVTGEAYCENCRAFRPVIEGEPHEDALNEHPWYDVVCGVCAWVLLTVRLVPETAH